MKKKKKLEPYKRIKKSAIKLDREEKIVVIKRIKKKDDSG